MCVCVCVCFHYFLGLLFIYLVLRLSTHRAHTHPLLLTLSLTHTNTHPTWQRPERLGKYLTDIYGERLYQKDLDILQKSDRDHRLTVGLFNLGVQHIKRTTIYDSQAIVLQSWDLSHDLVSQMGNIASKYLNERRK